MYIMTTEKSLDGSIIAYILILKYTINSYDLPFANLHIVFSFNVVNVSITVVELSALISYD